MVIILQDIMLILIEVHGGMVVLIQEVMAIQDQAQVFIQEEDIIIGMDIRNQPNLLKLIVQTL